MSSQQIKLVQISKDIPTSMALMEGSHQKDVPGPNIALEPLKKDVADSDDQGKHLSSLTESHL